MTVDEISRGIRQMVLRALDEAYDRKAWHGPNLKTSLEGLEVEEASWRPAPDRHNIWEIVLHAAYWTHAVGRRLQGEKTVFPEEGEDWFPRPREATEAALRQDLALLDAQHHRLREIVEAIPIEDLHQPVKVGNGTVLENVLGIALHHVYHAGQIRLLKKLQE